MNAKVAAATRKRIEKARLVPVEGRVDNVPCIGVASIPFPGFPVTVFLAEDEEELGASVAFMVYGRTR